MSTRIILLFCVGLLAGAATGERISIFYGRPVEAERVKVVSGGGHFPVMIRLSDGALLAVFRGGDTHVGIGGRLDVARSTDGGSNWSFQTVADSPADDRNPALGQLRDGTVVLAWLVDRTYDAYGGRVPDDPEMVLHRDGLYVSRSFDSGKTWEDPVKSPIPVEHGASPYGKIVQLSDGTALMAVYYLEGRRKNWKETSLVYRSVDGGIRWGDPSVVAEGYNETALAVLPGDRLAAVLRGGEGVFLSSAFSEDGGRSWTVPAPVTQRGEHPGDLILLNDGRLLLTFGSRNRPYGARAMLSPILGLDWDPRVVVLAADADTTDCGYPSTVEIEPGKLATMYYGVDGEYDPYGKDPQSLSRSYARVVFWSVPE